MEQLLPWSEEWWMFATTGAVCVLEGQKKVAMVGCGMAVRWGSHDGGPMV
jgi:hypothetical protein